MAKVESPFMDIEQAAQFMRMGKSTFYRAARCSRKSGCPTRKHGKKYVFMKNELLAWSDFLSKKSGLGGSPPQGA